MVDKFQQGESSGRKIDPASVVRSMLTDVDSRGDRIFSSEDFLTASQTAGFFASLLMIHTSQCCSMNQLRYFALTCYSAWVEWGSPRADFNFRDLP